MKKIHCYLFLFALLLFSACTKKQQEAIAGSMDADISSDAPFSAIGTSNVVAQLDPSPTLPGKTQLTITGSQGNRTLTVAIIDYDENNPLGTYNFNGNTKKAIGGYNNGGTGGDDIIVSGTLALTLTAAGHLTQGTFSGTTQQGKQITNGSFSATY